MTVIEPKPGAKVDAKKIVSWAGSALMVVSIGFIFGRLRTYGLDLSLLTSPWVVAGLLVVAFIESLGIVGASLNYRAIIKNISGVKLFRPFAVMVYNVSNLYKYIPGGVMYVLGRNRLAVETEGLSHAKVAFATVFEGGLVALSGLVVALVFSFEHSIYYIRQLTFSPVFLVAAIAVPAVIFPPVYIFRKDIKQLFGQFFSTVEILKPAVFVKRFGFALFLMFLWGMSFVAVITLLGQPMTLSLALTVVGLYLLGWLAGFLTPGAPSGFGIREAVLLMLMPGMVVESVLLSAMLIHRIITVIGDVFAYCIAVIYERASKNENETQIPI